MNRRNFAATALALTAIALAPLTACKKDKGGASGASGDMLSHLPKDTTGVVGLSFSKARSSAVFKKYQDKILSDAPAELDKIKEKCGIDLVNDLGTIVISAGKSWKDESDIIIAVKGSFDKTKIEDCVKKMEGTVENGVYTIDADPMNAYWPSNDVMLISKEMTADKMKAAVAAGSIKDNADMMKLIGKTGSGSTVWAVGNVPAEMGAMMGGMGGAPPKSFYLNATIDSGLKATVGMLFEKEDDAKSLSTMATMGLSMAKGQPGVGELLEGVSMNQDGKSFVVKAKLSGDDLGKLEEMAGAGGLPF